MLCMASSVSWCYRENAIAEGDALPPEDHHAHYPDKGAIRWRPIVWADRKPTLAVRRVT